MKGTKYFAVFFIVSLFALSMYFTNDIYNIIYKYVEDNYLLSSLAYIFFLIASIVVAPISSPIFLISGWMFHPLLATFYNIAGWSIGAGIAFKIAKYFGRPMILKFISLKKLDYYESILPKNLEFWWIVLFRMITPVDILSYALGIFSNISFSRYMLATIIGITPFSIIFAYGGNIILKERYSTLVFLLILAIAIFTISTYFIKKKVS